MTPLIPRETEGSYWTGREKGARKVPFGFSRVDVIERAPKAEQKARKRDRKRREKGARKVPFGFSRALVEGSGETEREQ